MPNIETIMETGHEDTGAGGSLGLDEHGQLYWNGEPIVTKQRVTLDWWVGLAVIIGGFSTFVVAAFTVLMYFSPPGSVV